MFAHAAHHAAFCRCEHIIGFARHRFSIGINASGDYVVVAVFECPARFKHGLGVEIAVQPLQIHKQHIVGAGVVARRKHVQPHSQQGRGQHFLHHAAHAMPHGLRPGVELRNHKLCFAVHTADNAVAVKVIRHGDLRHAQVFAGQRVGLDRLKGAFKQIIARGGAARAAAQKCEQHQ